MIDRPQNKRMREATSATSATSGTASRKDGGTSSPESSAARAIREFTEEMPFHQVGTVDWERMLKQAHDQTVSLVQKYPATCLIVGFAIGGFAGWLVKRQK